MSEADERVAIANLEQEDLEKLKEKINNAEEGEEISLGEEQPEEKPIEKPAETEEKPTEKLAEAEEKPIEKPAETKDEPTETPPAKNEKEQIIDQYLSELNEKQDLSKYSIEELQKIIHVQNKRIYDKDGFITTLQKEKRAERSQLREEINKLQQQYEEKKKNRLSKEELNDKFREDPIGTQEEIEKYKQEDSIAEKELLENKAKEKRLYNEELMMNIDQQSDVGFKDLIPEMKEVLKRTHVFRDEQIEAFAKDPFLEDIEVLIDLRKKALALKKEGVRSSNQEPQRDADKITQRVEEKRKEDIIEKINKAATRTTNPIKGTGGKTPDANMIEGLRQIKTGKYDLSSLSSEELNKLKKQVSNLED